MKTLNNALSIGALIVVAFSFSASAMHAEFLKKDKHIIRCNSGGIDTTIYTMVDVAPNFPGGITAFSEFLARNIKYPAIDIENKITGKVFVIFIVEADGSLSNIKAVRAPSETLKAEAIRVLSGSPKWKPGRTNGNAVRVQFTVPVNFELPK